ncbi:peptidase S8 [Bacillus thuringiensis]|nr:peptidase S8 [Bacillus thuringiensis]PFJ58576.1 peptidase S8 [Bacillus thuringiensis]
MKGRKRMKKIFSFIVLLTFFVVLIPFQNTYAEETKDYYTILVKDEKDIQETIKKISAQNTQIVYTVPEVGLVQVRSTESEIKNISKIDAIDTYNKSLKLIDSHEEINKSNNVKTLPALWESQWDMKKITNNGESYNVFSGSKNVTVGIVDSGLDTNHPDLKNNIVVGSKNLVPLGGYKGEEPEETGDVNQLTDFLGHGTHTAGLVAANGSIKGVAPEVGIKSYRVFGRKSGDTAWVIKGIVEAAKDDVDVINLSLGSYLVNGTTFSANGKSKKDIADIKAYKKAIDFARKQGSIVVAAAGNDALNMRDKKQVAEFYNKKYEKDGITFKGEVLDVPADLPNVVTVSSIGPSNELSMFSNYGADFVDIAAPGGDTRLLNTYGKDAWINDKWFAKESILSTFPGGYSYSSGVSTAAPKVSGALALIIDKYHFKDQPNKATKFLYKYGVDNRVKNKEQFGNGILDVYKAVTH